MQLKKSGLILCCLVAVLLIIGTAGEVLAAKPAPQPTQPTAAPAPAFVIPIEIREYSADALGTTLVQRTRDAFAADNRFKIVSVSEPNRLIIRLYTRGVVSKEPQTAYSFTVTYKFADNPDELYAGSTIGTCLLKEVPDDAKAIANMTWDQAANYANLLEKVKQVRK
jgi:hypothetical protein